MSDVQGKFAGLEPDHKPRRTARDGAGVVTLLPKQLWSSLKVSGDGDVVCEVGWLLGHGSAVTTTCVLSRDGAVKVNITACCYVKIHFFLYCLRCCLGRV